MNSSVSINLSEVYIPEAIIVGAQTRLIDRAVPICPRIILPSVPLLEGELKVQAQENSTTSSKQKGRLRSLILKNQPVKHIQGSWLIDLRVNYPENWAHAFTNHLPITVQIAEKMALPESELTLIFPADISAKIVGLFQRFGFKTLETDRVVKGNILHFTLTPWIAIRSQRVNIVNRCLTDLTKTAKLASKEKCLADHVFLSRKDHRKLSNENEIEQQLLSQGFRKIYLEEYSLEQQISTLAYASNIVAVHGAALGPLILRNLYNAKPYKLTEIFSPAHVTNVFRAIAYQTGGNWSGVQGKVWPELLSGKANFSNNLDDFEADPKSLELAMQAI